MKSAKVASGAECRRRRRGEELVGQMEDFQHVFQKKHNISDIEKEKSIQKRKYNHHSILGFTEKNIS